MTFLKNYKIKIVEKKKIKLSLSFQVLIFSIISLIWIFLYKLLFLKIGEFFPKAFQIGEIFYSIATSVVASSIFYYIVVYKPAKRNLELIRPGINELMTNFLQIYISIISNINRHKGLGGSLAIPKDFEGFRKYCEGIILTDKAPIITEDPSFQPKDWFEFFEYYFAQENNVISHLHNYWEYIPSEGKTLLQELQKSSLHTGVYQYKFNGYSNKLYDLAGPLMNHLDILLKVPGTLNMKI